MYKQANEMRDTHKQVTSPMQDGRGKHIVIPLVNHLLLLSLNEGLRNGNVNHKHIFPPQYGSPNFVLSCLPVSSSSEWPSPRANLVENENYLNILGELGESCVLSEPHFTCRVYGSTLSYCVTCLCSPDRRGRMKLKLVLGIYVCEGAPTHSHRGTHTNIHTGSISVQS